MAKPDEFAMDASIAPGGVLGSESQNESSDLGGG